MNITVTELVLFVWASYATIVAFHAHAMLGTAKRFTLHLLDDPEVYASLRKSIQQAQEKHNATHL